MSKTNDTSKRDRTKIENRVLADSELDAVSGGDASLISTMLKDLHDVRAAIVRNMAE